MWILFLILFIVFCIYMAFKTSKLNKGSKLDSPSVSASSSSYTYSPPPPAQVSNSSKPAYQFFDEMNGMVLAYQYHDVGVALFQNSELPASSLHVGDMVFIRQDKDNPYDQNAVSIIFDSKKLGYLYKGRLQDMANDWINKDLEMWSYISLVDIPNKKINIAIGFYKEGKYLSLKKSGMPCKKYRLTGNRNEEMQSNILLCSVGDEVTFFYDDEKEKNLVSAEYEVGYLPASANSLVENYAPAYIDSIDTDDNDKYVVTIAIFPND